MSAERGPYPWGFSATSQPIVFVALADARMEGGAVSAGYELDQAYLRASLAEAGVASRQYVDAVPGSLARLARRLLAQRPRLLVLHAGPEAPPLVHEIAEALRRIAPETPLAYSGVGLDDHDRVFEEFEAVDLCVAASAESAFTAFVTGFATGCATAGDAIHRARALPGLTPRGQACLDLERLPKPALDQLASPYLTGVVPARAAAVIGVQTDRDDPADSARRCCHPPERIRAELDWIAERTTQTQLVPLIGDVFTRDPKSALGLCDVLTDGPWRRLALRATVDPDVDPQVLAALAESGFAEVVIRVDGPGDDDPSDVGERVMDMIEALEPAGVLARVHLRLRADGDTLAAAEHLIAEIADASPGFTFEWRDDRSGLTGPPSGIVAPELEVSSTRQRRRQARRQLVSRLREMEEGVYADVPGYSEAVRDLWWDHPSSPAEHREWLSGIVGFDSVLFHSISDGGRGVRQAAIALCRTAVVERTKGRWMIGGSEACTVSGYAAAREREPLAPLLLALDSPDDLDAFLTDADEARQTGAFRPLVCHPLTTIRGAARWAGLGGDARLLRLFVGVDGELRCSPTAPPLGEIGDSFTTLRERARERLSVEDSAEHLGAQVDPSGMGIALRARPWLAQYVSVPRALRRLVGEHPELAASDGLRGVRVSGFGGCLCYDGEGSPSTADPLLIAVGERCYLFDQRSDRIVRMTPDTAALFEALSCTDELTAAQWLVVRRDLSIEAAREGLATVREMLRTADMLPERRESGRLVAREGAAT